MINDKLKTYLQLLFISTIVNVIPHLLFFQDMLKHTPKFIIVTWVCLILIEEFRK